jgi:hypothetical protein
MDSAACPTWHRMDSAALGRMRHCNRRVGKSRAATGDASWAIAQKIKSQKILQVGVGFSRRRTSLIRPPGLAAAHTAQATSASVPIPGTTNTAGQAPASRPPRAGGGQLCADRSLGSSRSLGKTSGQSPIRTVDDELCLDARGPVRLQPGGAGLDVETSCSDAHGRHYQGTSLRSRSCVLIARTSNFCRRRRL